jgi:glycosyltransferase involved in cell wall biosynthesis
MPLSPNLAELPPPPEGESGWPWTVEGPQVVHMPDYPVRISIVTPSLNQGEFLEETIRSVLLQGYSDLEYVIIDGGSTDDSVDIIRKYEPWLTYWSSEPDGGQADAINRGFSICTGELRAFLNSDDVYAAGAFDGIVSAWVRAGQPEDALISGRVQDISHDGTLLPDIFEPTRMGSLKEWVFGGISLHQPGCLWTASTWKRFGPFPNDLNYMFDRYFFSKIAAQGDTAFITADAPIASFRLHEKCKTVSQIQDFAPEWNRAMERLRVQLPLPQRLEITFLKWKKENWELACTVLSERDVTTARRLLAQHISKDPASILLRPVFGAAWRLLLKKTL